MRPVISSPSSWIEPCVASTRPSSVRPSVVLPEPDSPTTPEHLALAEVERDAVDRADRAGVAALEAVEERAPDRVGRVQVADLEQGLASPSGCSSGSLMPPPPRGTRSRSSGSRPPGGDLRLGPVQPAGDPLARRAPGPRSGAGTAQTFIAFGQRGWKRQAGGGSIRLGGAPGM